MIYAVLYVIAIVVVNYGFTVLPLVPMPTGEMWPPMSLAVGLVFVLRDFAQREIGHRVLALMLIGGLLSWWTASPFVAFASLSAFAVSELADWALYSFSKRPFHERVLWSSIIAAPLDSVVFLSFIGHLSVIGVAAMVVSKMAGAFMVWVYLKGPCALGLHKWEPHDRENWFFDQYYRCGRCAKGKVSSGSPYGP